MLENIDIEIWVEDDLAPCNILKEEIIDKDEWCNCGEHCTGRDCSPYKCWEHYIQNFRIFEKIMGRV